MIYFVTAAKRNRSKKQSHYYASETKFQSSLFLHFRKCHTVGQDCQKCKETSNLDVIVMSWIWIRLDTSGPLVDKKQKRGEHVENTKFSLDTQIEGLRFLYIFGDPGLLSGIH